MQQDLYATARIESRQGPLLHIDESVLM